MKAAYLNKINSLLKISKDIRHEKLLHGQVLVKILYTGICRSQLFEIFDGRNNKKYIPHLLGHEATGIIIKKHSSVKKIKVKDRVILTWIKCAGIQSKNPVYYDGLKKLNSGSVTTFSNYSIVSENRILKLPNDISFKRGVILGCAFPTGAGMVINKKIKPENKKIGFVGLGGVGVAALVSSLNFNFKEICAFDIDKKKLNFLEKNIKTKKKIYFYNLDKKIKSKFKNYFDYIIETSGNIGGIQHGFELLNYKGTMIFASHPKKGKKIKLDPFEFIKGKKIFGSWGGDINYEKQSKLLFNLFRKIRNYNSLFAEKTYSFDQINSALLDFKSNKILRPIIKMP